MNSINNDAVLWGVIICIALSFLVPCLSGCHRHLPDVVFRDFTE